MVTATGTIEVCIDCLMKRENDVAEGLTAERIAELWQDFAQVTLGIGRSEHLCGVEEHVSSTSTLTGDVKCSCGFFYCEIASEIVDAGMCDCDRITFSAHHCDACGSTLAGERQLYTVWEVPALTTV
jgi:hypothetical protein